MVFIGVCMTILPELGAEADCIGEAGRKNDIIQIDRRQER